MEAPLANFLLLGPRVGIPLAGGSFLVVFFWLLKAQKPLFLLLQFPCKPLCELCDEKQYMLID